MNQMLQIPRLTKPTWLKAAAAAPSERLAGDAMLPTLYRSEAFGEDLADMYPELRFDADTYPVAHSRLGMRRALGGVAVAVLWASSMVLATVVLIHNTLA